MSIVYSVCIFCAFCGLCVFFCAVRVRLLDVLCVCFRMPYCVHCLVLVTFHLCDSKVCIHKCACSNVCSLWVCVLECV